MKDYLFNLWDSLRSSYWFVPSLFVSAAFLLSYALPRLDESLLDSDLPKWARTTIDSALATLSAIAGVMVAVTGTVFSITIVTLSLTSQQFGPRLLRTFMHNSPTKLTLGLFLSTALYALLILHTVQGNPGVNEVPHLAVLFAVVLTASSLVMLIVFIHNVAQLIQAPQIVENVAKELNEAIELMFPNSIGAAAEESLVNAEEFEQRTFNSGALTVCSQKEGYIQAMNLESLLPYTAEHDLVIRFYCRPGDFLMPQKRIADISGAGSQTISAGTLTEKINQGILVGITRTPRQDIECTINELVEVAVRSLSSGINDPFTAISCIDRLSVSLRCLAGRCMPEKLRCDSEGQPRLVLKATTFPALVNAALNQIRQNSVRSVAVALRLLEALGSIAEVAKRPADKQALKQHADMVYRITRQYSEDLDKSAADKRYEKFLESI